MVIVRDFQILIIIILTNTVSLFPQTGMPDFLTETDSDGYTLKQDSVTTFLLKGFRIRMDENALKCNLIRLTRFSKGKGLNRYEPLELYAWRMNNNTDEIKNTMMGWVFAGGVASQAAKMVRTILNRYHIRQVYTNLSGVHMRYPDLLFSSRLSASVYPTGESVMLSNRTNSISIRYYRTPYSDSFDTGVRVMQNNMISLSRIKYRDVYLNRLGISHFQRNFYFRLNYTLHFSQSRYNRIDFVLSWII